MKKSLLVGALFVCLAAQAGWVGTYSAAEGSGTLSDGNWLLSFGYGSIRNGDETTFNGWMITKVKEGSGVLDLRNVGAEADPQGTMPQYRPKKLADRLFSESTTVTGVYLHDECVEVGGQAFMSCSALEFFHAGAGLRTIGGYTFQRCSALTAVTLPEGMTCIDAYAFDRCMNLASFPRTEFPSLQSIGMGAFSNCSSLSGDFVFSCPKLTAFPGKASSYAGVFTSSAIKSLDFSRSGVVDVGDYTCYACSSLTNVLFSPSVRSIGSTAFYNCAKLGDVDLSGGTNYLSIGTSAFSYCTSVKNVLMSPFVTNFASSAFARCQNITNVTIVLPQDRERWVGMMKDVDGTLGKDAFYAAGKLVALDLPWGGETVWATNALAGVGGLKSLRFYGKPPTIEPCRAAFDLAYQGTTIVANQPQAYQMRIYSPHRHREGWRSFCTAAVTDAERRRGDYPGQHVLGTFASPNKEWVVWERNAYDDPPPGCVIMVR